MTFPEDGKERLALDLCMRTVEQVVERSKLTEVMGADGGAFAILTNERTGGEVGELRIWQGDGVIRKAVYAGIWAHVPGVITLDSHMVFVFTDTDSGVPHFTLDSVERGDLDTHAFHLDLIPRVDLATHLTLHRRGLRADPAVLQRRQVDRRPVHGGDRAAAARADVAVHAGLPRDPRGLSPARRLRQRLLRAVPHARGDGPVRGHLGGHR